MALRPRQAIQRSYAIIGLQETLGFFALTPESNGFFLAYSLRLALVR